MELLQAGWVVLAYVLVGRLIYSLPVGQLRDFAFASANIAAVTLIYNWGELYWVLAAYLAIILVQYLVAFVFPVTKEYFWPGALFPIVVLFLLKYLPDEVYSQLGLAQGSNSGPVFIGMVGLSYMAFRLSYLVAEVRNGAIPKPNVAQYLSFATFLPTLAVGPISRMRTFHLSYGKEVEGPSIIDSVLRVALGVAKFTFLAAIFSQFTFDAYLLDRHIHHPVELLLACFGFYLFLYFNFSGFCDIAVGLAGLVGIAVDENFNNPFISRNVQDFWNRWHMTLNAYMRDMLFTPMSKFLVHKMGAKHLNLAIVCTLFTVFLLIGIWHGRELQYLLFGLIHAAGVSLVHVYGLVLKRRLGTRKYKRYMQSRLVRCVSICTTFVFVSLSFLVFANSPEQVLRVLQAVSLIGVS